MPDINRVWVRAPEHVRPVDGVDYDQVATERLEAAQQSVVHEVLGERRPSGWVLQALGDGRGPSGGVLHAPDCDEAPPGAPLLDLDHALAVAVERMLTRDDWHVIAMPDEGRPRLYARDRGGRQLDVAFRPADEATDEDAPAAPAPTLREAGRPGVDNIIRVVVSRGSYSRTDVLWASRQGGVRLVDGRQLQQWGAGAPLDLDDYGLPG